jgi:O-6-methylguanine DNA methyltransferase
MIQALIHEIDSRWYGVALCDGAFVATVVERSRSDAIASMRHLIEPQIEILEEQIPTRDFDYALACMHDLETGGKPPMDVALCRSTFTDSALRIYTVASRIPVGYVTSYAAIARAAGSEARAVGQAMANNPLYPIVPCHRVVGSDFSMVGYGGRQDTDALDSKYSRLEAEARGYTREESHQIDGAYLKLYPVEAALESVRASAARSAWKDRQERMHSIASEAQLSLF